MDNIDDGLATPKQVEALADQLSACADQLHLRLEHEAAAIAAMPDGPARSRRRTQLEAMLGDEQQLRQRANHLYHDAATAVVAKLGTPQRDVIALTDAAAEKIRKITLLGDAAGLVAGLLALAGGVAGGQPGPVLAALHTIRVQVAAVKAGLPPKAP